MTNWRKNWPSLNHRSLVGAVVVGLLVWPAVLIIRPMSVQGIDWPYGTVGLYVVDVLLIAAIAWFRPTFSWVARPLYFSPLLLAIYLLGTSFLANDPLAAIWRWALLCLLIYFFVAIKKRIDRKYLVVGLILVGVLESALAIAQTLGQGIAASTWLGLSEHLPWQAGASVVETSDGRWLRAYGTFPHPNILGGYLAIISLVVVDEYFKVYLSFQTWWNKVGQFSKKIMGEIEVRQSGKKIAALLASLMLILAALLTTFSRSAILVFLMGLVFYLWLRRRENSLITNVLAVKLFFGLAILGLGFAHLLPNEVVTRLTINGRLEERSLSERSQSMSSGLSQFWESPLVGTGLSNIGASDRYLEPPHNAFILYLMQVGIIGIIITLLVVAPSFPRLLNAPWRPLPMALIFVLLTISLFDHYLWSLHAGLMVLITALLFI